MKIALMFFAVVVLCPMSASLVWAYSDQEMIQQIQNTIAQRHPEDNASWWRSLGERAPDVIMGMYKSSTHIYYRIRLIEALGWFNRADVSSFLKEVAANESNRVLQNAAIRAVAKSQGMKEKEFFNQYLNHTDPVVRSETAKSISLLHDKNGDEMVGQFLSDEKTPWVVSRVKAHRSHLATHQSIVHKKSKRNF
jgi:hypothetical protein